ncbi:hypothetical protein [Salinimonas sediminis]|uniref:DUF3592 domain-containing protein n=1 Tax=Salinimonas sediminis TaxID=2303538 RepID=A0A346NNN6_9ALTE|nr:hypothetical protein [Salinimonas sediminis]AXR07143.1 hypothetical protein D0Y50_12770 [Salinimonas sediminis]
MKSRIAEYIYTLSGFIVVLISLALLYWGISNRSFPDYSATKVIAGKASNVEVLGWKIRFKIEGYDEPIIYYRHFGNFNLVEKLLADTEREVELIIDNAENLSDSTVYEISIDGEKVTNFSEKKSNHGEYTKSVYILSAVLFLLGCFGVYLGMRKKSFVAQSD